MYASKLIRDFVERFNKDAAPSHLPSPRWSPTYHEVQDVLYLVASKYPICMDGVLYDMCADTTASQLASSKELTWWCGCHMPPSVYEEYATQFGLRKECSPMCTAEGTIPSVNASGEPDRCTQSVCIVDNVAVATSQSKVGDISISQICTHCKDKNSCRCIIDGVDIKIKSSEVAGSLKAVQELCGDTICTIQNPTDPHSKINIPCTGPSIIYYEYLEKLRQRDKKQSGLAISVCVLLICMLIAIFLVRRL